MQMTSVRVAHFHSPNHLDPTPEKQTILIDLRCEPGPEIITMSYFGKLKNCGSPAPPRTDNSSRWPLEEFDDEEGDMYEVPPCERPVVKVQADWCKGEENLYLERMSSPAVPQRQAVPLPRPGKASTPQQTTEDLGYFPKTKKPPEIDRDEKPGRKKMMPPPMACSAPPQYPASIPEEDVYLDPNEEQDSEELYLEPTAACSLAPCTSMRMPPSPKTAPAPSPKHIMKPPLPKAKSNSVFSFLNDLKTGSSVEVRQATFLPKVSPPNPDMKPFLKEAPPSPSNPAMADTKPVAPPRGRRASKHHGNEDKDWFAGDCNRKKAEDLLLRLNKDGSFLIRQSSGQSARQPYTLAVLYQQKVYNIPVRFLEETRAYALGKEGKKNEEIFGSLDEIISHHRNNYLLLIDSKSQSKHKVYLTHPAHP
ncbi:SH2 domain-containing protein 6 isoform X1 [Antennarius striatus]|uniref:SH2 domain-containing protein 6 isoform X1 n=1 Tax=Antennarius striatus TaxID=241820 RepID=UPI0035B2A22D